MLGNHFHFLFFHISLVINTCLTRIPSTVKPKITFNHTILGMVMENLPIPKGKVSPIFLNLIMGLLGPNDPIDFLFLIVSLDKKQFLVHFDPITLSILYVLFSHHCTSILWVRVQVRKPCRPIFDLSWFP